MTFLTPTIAGIVAAIAIPSLVILYFLKLRRRNIEIGSTLLWKKAVQDMQANAPFQKLRRNVLLFMQLLALIVALLALAQPMMDTDLSGGKRHVLIIDRSASMTVADEAEGRTRLEEAKRRATELVDSMRGAGFMGIGGGTVADEAMLIVFDAQAEVRERFTSDKDRLKRAIEAIEPTDAPGLVEGAFVLAEAHAPKRIYLDDRTGESHELEGLSGGAPAVVTLYSDGALADAAKAKPRTGDDLRFERVGGDRTPNVSITGLRAEREFGDPSQVTVFVGVQSTFAQAETVDVQLLIDGRVAAVKEAILPAPAPGPADVRKEPTATGVVFKLRRAEAALLGVELAVPEGDALASDNAGAFDLPPARSASVALVTEGSVFLVSALEGLPLARLVLYTPEQYQRDLVAGKMDAFDVVVLDGVLPEGGALPPGRSLILGAVPEPLAVRAGEDGSALAGTAVMLDWDRDHPALRDVDLSNVVVASMPGVLTPEELPEGFTVTPLARADVGPAVLEVTGPASRAVVVPFDPSDSNWPFDVSFIVFTAAVTLDLAGPGASIGAPAELRPGQVLTDRLPAGASDVRLVLADGSSEPLAPAADGRIAFGPIRDVGVYRVEFEGEGSRQTRTFAANLLDPKESDVRSQETLTTASVVATAQDGAGRDRPTALWPIALLLALLLVLAEWFVYNRKVEL